MLTAASASPRPHTTSVPTGAETGPMGMTHQTTPPGPAPNTPQHRTRTPHTPQCRYGVDPVGIPASAITFRRDGVG
jgi:hypothetical protein